MHACLRIKTYVYNKKISSPFHCDARFKLNTVATSLWVIEIVTIFPTHTATVAMAIYKKLMKELVYWRLKEVIF